MYKTILQTVRAFFGFLPANLNLPTDAQYLASSQSVLYIYKGIKAYFPVQMVIDCEDHGVDPYEGFRDAVDDVIREDNMAEVETEDES